MSKMGEHYIRVLNGDEPDEVKCASCDEWLDRKDSFQHGETREYFHPACANVKRCNVCGRWVRIGYAHRCE